MAPAHMLYCSHVVVALLMAASCSTHTPSSTLDETRTVKLVMHEGSARTAYEGSVPPTVLVAKKLLRAGLQIVGDEKLVALIKRYAGEDALVSSHGQVDAILFVDYRGIVHEEVRYVRGLPVSKTTATVRWHLKLENRGGSPLFEREVTGDGLVSVFAEAGESLYLAYLGDFTKSLIEGQGLRPVLLKALESYSEAVRDEARRALSELAD